MDRDTIVGFLKELSGPNVVINHHDEWVTSLCPLAEWTHDSGQDTNPSFGISVHDDGDSIFNCFTCHKKGTLAYLLKLISRYSGEDLSDLIEDTETTELVGLDAPRWEDSGIWNSKEPDPEPLDAVFENLFDLALGHPYLRQRGITDKTVEAIQIGLDPDNHGVERIVFPVFGRDHRLYGYTGRAVGDAQPKVRDYYGLPKRSLLLGAELVAPEDDKVIVVEGLFDFAKLYQYGFPAVAVMHSSLTAKQAGILIEIDKPVYLMYDNDQAGRDGVEDAATMLDKHLPVLICPYPRGVKDPDGMTEAQVERSLDHADFV